ncbi:MAG: DUF423 domain-containing protein [Bacteroidia bacterium]|nr:DUF423 domain-containing protein [Bacteroidia bacterium]
MQQAVRWARGLGAILGLTGVIAGALGSHALENSLSPDQLDAFETAVRFQLFHALLLLILGLWLERRPDGLLRASVWLTVAGVLAFSGSIYLLTLTPLRPGLVTPLGGLLLMAAWACLIAAAFRPLKS